MTPSDTDDLPQKNCRLVREIENSFIDSHQRDFHLGPDTYLKLNNLAIKPFGVYGLEVDGIIVGLHSITPLYHGDYLVGSVVSDIFKEHRGKGYGTLLRKLAGAEAAKLIGSPVRLKGQDGETLTKFPLSFVFSNNEWMYGENWASTWSSLKAGYGIACISGIGLAKMLYPRNNSMWSEERVQNLKQASLILGNGNTNHLEAIPYFLNIIQDLDLTQDTDVITLDSFISFMSSKFGSEKEYEISIDACVRKLTPTYLAQLCDAIRGDAKKEYTQIIPVEMLMYQPGLSEQSKSHINQILIRTGLNQ